MRPSSAFGFCEEFRRLAGMRNSRTEDTGDSLATEKRAHARSNRQQRMKSHFPKSVVLKIDVQEMLYRTRMALTFNPPVPELLRPRKQSH
jgi:hypothetical protein